MRFEFNENVFYMLFEVSEEGFLRLLNFSSDNKIRLSENQQRYAQAVEVHLSGDNQNDHHGAKHTCCGSRQSLKYISHKITSEKLGKLLEIYLSDERIRVTLRYFAYNGVKALRCNTVVENISNENIGIEYISSFALTGIGNDKGYLYIPTNAWVREADWKKYSLGELGLERDTPFSTKRINISNTGTWSAKEYLPMGCFETGDEAYLWQIESGTSWNWELGDINDTLYLKLSGPSENENHWWKELKSGECFSSVTAAICIGNNFNDALSEMTSYRRRIIRRNTSDENLPVIFNDYMNCLYADPTEEKMLPVIDRAAEVGAEYYCMDAGWYADGTWWETVGEWKPCDKRFPNGIKKVFDYIKSKGMIPGIWLEIEVMGIGCPILDQFDDSCFFMRHGKRVIDHGRYQFDFRSEKVRKFATGIIDRVINEYGVGYIKMDYNIDGGIGTEINSDSFGDGLMEHNLAYLDWISGIMDKYPELIIENCSSGGMRMDYAMLSVHPIQSVSDRGDADGLSFISAASPTAVLPEQAAIWSCPKAEEDNSAVSVHMLNSLLMRMHLSGEITQLSDEQLNIVKSGVECYKQTRGYIKESVPFYPIGLPGYSDNIFCCAYKNDDKVFLKVWRRSGEENRINIPAENPKNINILFGGENCTVSTNEKEITVEFKEKKSAVLIEMNI